MSRPRNAIEGASDGDDWAPLPSVGNIITNQRQVSDLIKAAAPFEIERHNPGDGNRR